MESLSQLDRPSPSPWAAVAVTLCGVCAFLQLYCTQPLLPLLTHLFHASKTAVGLTVSAATLGVALSAPVFGALTEKLARKRVGYDVSRYGPPMPYPPESVGGPIVDDAALIAALDSSRLAGAGLDVFDVEPLPADHPFRTMANVTLTPHLGYVTRETMKAFYGDMPEAIQAFADGTPIRVANPDALKA